MKTVLFLILALSFKAQAQPMTPAEFTQVFAARINELIVLANAERKAENKGLYCAQLNKEQLKLIRKTAAQPEITVGAFASVITENLKCYPLYWDAWGQKKMPGFLFNTKALVLDSILVRTAIEDLAPSRYVHEEEALLNFPSR